MSVNNHAQLRADSVHPTTTGAFARFANEILDIGGVPIPCGGQDGKRSLIKGWTSWTPSMARRNLPQIKSRFPESNLGIACGQSGVAVVDIDDAKLFETIIDEFGQTPLVIRSPSGGYHLYYDATSETVLSANLRTSHGWDVDIKARGGLVVGAPSQNPMTGKAYEFFLGSWADLRHLPRFPAETLANSRLTNDRGDEQSRDLGRLVAKGNRNNHLFRELLKHAPYCDDFNDLLDVARTRNGFAFEASLPDKEVFDTATSAWRYQTEGRNWIGMSPHTILSREKILFFAEHKKGGDALLLWAYLEGQHSKRIEPFAVDREAMAKAQILPGWKAWRYRVAIETLRDLGLLLVVSGPYRRGDQTLSPYLYRLARPLAGSRQHTIGTAPSQSRSDHLGGD